MDYYKYTLLIISGICAFSALQHCAHAQDRSKRRIHLLFAAISLLMVFHTLLLAYLLQTKTLADFILAARLQASIHILFVGSLPAFFAAYSGVRPRFILPAYSALVVMLYLVNLMQPFTLSHSEIHALEFVAMPWGEKISRPLGTMSAWMFIAIPANFFPTVFGMYALQVRFRQDRRRKYLIMMFAVGLLLAGTTAGLMFRMGVANLPPLGPVAFMAMVVVMGMTLGYETQEDRRHLKAILDHVPAYIYLKDRNGKYLSVNRHFENTFHVSDGSAPGKTDYDLFPQKQAEVLHAADQHLFDTRQSIEQEETIESRTYLTTRVPLFNKDGSPYATCGIATDISTLKKLEQELSQREAELLSIYMAVPIGIASVNDRKFLKVNDAMCKMFGYTPDELIGQYTRILYARDEDFKEFGSNVYSQAMNNDSTMLEIQGITKQGDTLNALVGIAPLVRGDASAGYVISVLDVTERIKAVQALEESEKRFQAIFDDNPLSICLHEIETGAYVDVNRRCCELHGISKELVSGKRADELGIVSKEDFQQFHDLFLETGSIDQKELTCVDYKGEVFPMLISARAIEISGKMYGITMSQDISEKKQAEEDLKKSEEKFRNIFENAPIGIFQSLPSGQYLTVNVLYAHIFGYETAEDMISAVRDIPNQLYAHPGQRADILRRLEKSDMVVSEDLEAIRKDGSHFYIDLYMRAVRDEKGNMVMLEGFLTDATERKNIQDRLAEREEQMRLYIERLPVACIVFDNEITIQNWNPAAERVFGFSRDEAIGKKATELMVPPFARAQVEQVWQRLLAGDLEATSTNENITKDGRTILCEWTNTPYYDAVGKVSGVISVVQDITERKLAQEMMVQNEKMAMVGGLAAGLAHEINNPVGIIVQAVQIMERRLSPELEVNARIAEEMGLDLGLMRNYLEKREIFDFIASMREAGKRTTKIITNMLQFTRKSDSWDQISNLPDVIEQAIEMSESDYDLRKKYDIRNVKIIRDYEHNLPQISINITEIEQVLINLIKNAAQAMCEDGSIAEPTIRINVSRLGESLVMKISDNGPGMTDEVRKRIFEPFYTTKEVGTGTGLGLAVSYMLITNNHKGNIEVESSLGSGTCFTIKLPLAKQLKGTSW